MSQRIGADFFEAGVLREPLERPAGREDQPRFAALLALQNFAGASPMRRPRIRLR